MVIYELHVGTFSGRNDGLNRMVGSATSWTGTSITCCIWA